MKKLLIFLILALAAPLHAQAVVQSGAITAYHPSIFFRNGVIGDGGTTTAPAINQIGMFNGSGCPFGISSQSSIGSTGSAYGLLTICQTSSTTTFKVRGLNGNATPSIQFDIGGTLYPFPQTNLGMTVGVTTIASGTTGRVLYDNAGLLGELATTGTGSIVLAASPTITSPTLVTPALGTPASGVATNLTGTAAGLTAGHVTTNANLTGPITSSGNATAIGAQTGTGSTFVMQTSPSITTPALSAATVSTAAAVTAGTNAQGQAPLTSDNNIITTAAASPSGTTLPAAAAGRIVTIANEGANTVNVYPASGAAIDALGANTLIALPATNVMTFYAASATQWYSTYQLVTAFTAGTGTVTSVGLSGGTTGLTISGTPVTTAGTLTLSGGVLVVANGGTGAATLTGLVLGNGTSAMTTVAAPAGTVVGTSDTQTLSAKRITPRIGTTASGATITPTSDTADQYNVTALATNATIAAPSGTPTDGQTLIIRILDNGTARTLAWDATYRAIGLTLPSTTVISKIIYVGCVWNQTSSTWDVLAVASQA